MISMPSLRNHHKTPVLQQLQLALIGVFFIFCPIYLNSSIVLAAPPKLTQAEVEKARTVLEKIKKLQQQLQETVPNLVGVRIARIEDPAEIESIISQAEEILQESIKSPELRPYQIRSLVLQGLQMLYQGRGNTSSRDGTGWYSINRRGPTGLPEIERILSRGLLDSEGKKIFVQFIENHDFESEQEKKRAGFPPQFSIGNDSIKSEVLKQIKAAPVATSYQSIRELSGAEPTVAETIDQAVSSNRITNFEGKELKDFINSVETNHFDKSVRTLNDPNKDFTEYFGREDESHKLLNALTKLDKGHVLLTGKAGVGKTTVIKMLSDAFIQKKLKIRDEAVPIILELPITAVTNATDPTVIKSMVKQAENLSRALDRRVILYIDEAHISTSMTRNALKGFLANMIEPIPENGKVHVIFSTTSQESRDFLSDSAFSRRFTEIHIPEFNRDQTIKLIKQSYEPIWKRYHRKNGYEFSGISDEAYEYAYRYASHEQPHAGNPTGTKEILEAAIVTKLNSNITDENSSFILEAKDIQNYIRDHLHVALVPGDPEFEKKFQQKWAEFNEDYVGNEGAKSVIEEMVRSHFGQVTKNKMTALVNFGPPGGGKSYGAEMIAKHFFDNAMLTINGAEFSNGGTGAESKLIGSPTGHVGSEEQRAILTKFIKDNPQGGVIKIEEADYLHQDVIRLFTNMITDKRFMDGLGKEWQTSKFILWMNSNIGQELMIPVDSKNQMTWEQFNTRRKQGTEHVIIKGGKEVERIKPHLLDEVFEQFVHQIVTQSNPGGDTSAVSQEAQKQKRRYRSIYTLPPNREELIEAAHSRVKRFIHDSQVEYGIHFNIPAEQIEKIINIEHYEFEKGYSYVIDQLEDKLFRNITTHLHERGKTIDIRLEDYVAKVNGVEIPSHRLIVQVSGQEPTNYPLGASDPMPKNPWGDSEEMMNRIRNLSTKIYENGIRGNEEIIHKWKAQLKLKASDWNTRTVFTLLGTSGNGKTERFKALAKALYDQEQALFTISGITSKFDLSRFFRPPVGIQGGKEQTEFERWFLSRQKAGGGVILMDELLSFSGLTKAEVASRLEAFNELYDLLDEGYIRFGNTRYDARGFVIGITGNSLQEAFDKIGDDIDSESLVDKIKKRIGQKEVLEYLSQAGMDAPKVARLGIIDVLGPQPRSVTLNVAKAKLAVSIEKIKKEGRTSIEFAVEESILESLVERVTTAKLGMRQVNRAFEEWIKGPLNAIRFDFPHAKKIEMKLSTEGKTQWFVDGKEVALEGMKLSEESPEERNWNYLSEFGPQSTNRTVQLEDIPAPKKVKYTEETLHAVAIHELYGHWMTEVLLNRNNPADAISLIAGENYLGFVRLAEDELYRIKDLSKLIQQQIVLQAGHRAVFLDGQFATGGGHDGSARDPRAYPSDDIGKIDRMQDAMINNRLLPDLSEKSNPQHKHIIKLFLNDVLDEAADRIIQNGISSGKFKPLYDQLIQSKYLGKQELDQYVEKLDLTEFGDPNEYFLMYFENAVRVTKERWTHKKLTKNMDIVTQMANALVERLYQEAEKRTRNNPALNSRIVEMHQKNSGTLHHESTTCTGVFELLKVIK